MSQDYSNSKAAFGGLAPVGAIDAQEFSRTEPLITPEQLVARFLFGVPLYSFTPDPVTGQRAKLELEAIKDFIIRAVTSAEMETGVSIFPVEIDEKKEFDYGFWREFGYLRVNQRPVASVEKLAFTPANGQDIYVVSPEWIEPANFVRGQINLIPMVPAVGAVFVSSGSTFSGSSFLQFMPGMQWIPAIVRVSYTAGFPNANLPRIINELVGIIAAIEILSLLASTNRSTSYSIGADSFNQSQATPGPQVYKERIDYLMSRKAEFIKKIKNLYGLSISSNYL